MSVIECGWMSVCMPVSERVSVRAVWDGKEMPRVDDRVTARVHVSKVSVDG